MSAKVIAAISKSALPAPRSSTNRPFDPPSAAVAPQALVVRSPAWLDAPIAPTVTFWLPE